MDGEGQRQQKAMLLQLFTNLRSLATHGFVTEGRGACLVHNGQIQGYLGPGSFDDGDASDPRVVKMRSLVSTYDPESDMLVMVTETDAEGRWNIDTYRMGLDGTFRLDEMN